jgi:hypothetical protein
LVDLAKRYNVYHATKEKSNISKVIVSTHWGRSPSTLSASCHFATLSAKLPTGIFAKQLPDIFKR